MPDIATSAATEQNLSILANNSDQTESIPEQNEAGQPAIPPENTPGPLQVGSDQAEAFISEKRIGERIKHLRLKKAMGLVELGRHTGLSASFLSQLETGRVVPTLRNLARIAMVFSKDLSYFFEPEPHKLFRVNRSRDRARLPQTGVDEPTYFFESLGSLTPDRSLDPYFAEFLPQRPGREPKAHQHGGTEFLFLLTGELDLRHGEETHRVCAGDGVYFDASTSHGYLCAGTEPATAVIVTMQAPNGESIRGLMRMPNGSVSRIRNLRPPAAGSSPAARTGSAKVS